MLKSGIEVIIIDPSSYYYQRRGKIVEIEDDEDYDGYQCLIYFPELCEDWWCSSGDFEVISDKSIEATINRIEKRHLLCSK